MHLARSSTSQNFVVDFSDEASWVAFDLSPSAIDGLLASERPDALNTRWINIYFPQSQVDLLETLAKRYDFSPRLLALMASDPKVAQRSKSSLRRSQSGRRKRWSQRSKRFAAELDVEKGSEELSELSSISSHDSVGSGNLYKIVDDLWHYSSLDFGRNFTCIGYNSLYGTKHASVENNSDPLPHCVRVWTWLLICDDNTVISINEDPFPFTPSHQLDDLQLRILASTRHNLTTIFRSLSLAHEHPTSSLLPATSNPMSLLPLRARLGSTPQETIHRAADTPGLLLYYLFENWQNSYTLLTRRESRYGCELAQLRADMFAAPKLHHVDRLDTIAKELGILRRHYEAYNRIIDRLLEPQAASTASLQNSRVVSNASSLSVETARPVVVTAQESLLGVGLSSAARVRFKRLRDLIDLYALSEVEEYIKQKDSLVAMNFNLIAIKESLDVERLTRITLLLTKATILFLPVSLLMAYFSIPLREAEYGVGQFWVAFAVVFVLSWMALFAFGVFSGSVQTVDFWKGLWRGMRRLGRGVRSWDGAI